MNQELENTIINPMVRTYNPPMHAKGDPDKIKALLDEYRNALKNLSSDCLRKGWEDVKSKHETWTWPHFQVIRSACWKHKPATGIGNSGTREGKFPWEVRQEKLDEAVAKYLERFRVNNIYQESVAEGWESELMNYVKSVARTQGMYLIEGFPHIAWDSSCIHGECTDEKRYHFLKAQREQASTGEIDVPVPMEFVRDWKDNAARRKDFVEEKTEDKPQKEPSEFDKSIDAYIEQQLMERSLPEGETKNI